ncbi:secretory carrier-associated membrane protein [Anaeramoeba flamelloides]|uniref:Secretory carrier-associated membrane protein n=1 Tax=Anaeramoeba flamelloides TaxID=1746091 RepID=A0AAV7YFK3_9EUKA|nr:secretory carrier-associated membrane protein [Anaeramoeba flamelloides]
MINPFAEGSSSSDEVNPFNDDSVTKVVDNTNQQSYTNEPIQDQNFDNQEKKKPDPIDEGYKPPEYLQEENPLENNTVEERELMLERREQELLRREQELNQKSKASGIDLDRPPNWPKCRPFLFHDISKDIPQNCRAIVRKAYFCWIWGVTGILWNLVCMIAKLFVGDALGKGNDIVISILIPFFVIPLSWIFWYRLLYNATRKSKSSKFIIFFSTFSMWFLFSVFMVIGIKGTGSAGIINCIDLFGLNKVVGFFLLANIILWVFEIVLIVIIIKQVNSYYKSSSMTTEQAKQELGTEVGKQLASGMI